jgi:hypothetical protein
MVRERACGVRQTFAISALARSTGETKEPGTDPSLKPNPMLDLAALGSPLTGMESMADSLGFGKHLASSEFRPIEAITP